MKIDKLNYEIPYINIELKSQFESIHKVTCLKEKLFDIL